MHDVDGLNNQGVADCFSERKRRSASYKHTYIHFQLFYH